MLKASLTTTGRLDECINLAVKYITEGNADLEKSSADLKTHFRFATAQTHFCSGPTLFAVKLMVLLWVLSSILSLQTFHGAPGNNLCGAVHGF